MADTNFPDEWLARSLEGVLSPELLVELRTKAQPGQTLWETLVAQKVVNDAPILFRQGHFFLLHAPGGIIAAYRKCTHLGCAVPWNPSQSACFRRSRFAPPMFGHWNGFVNGSVFRFG